MVGYELKGHLVPRPPCIKLTIDGNFAINGKLATTMVTGLNSQSKIKFIMVVTNDVKVTIKGKFFATGPRAGTRTVNHVRSDDLLKYTTP